MVNTIQPRPHLYGIVIGTIVLNLIYFNSLSHIENSPKNAFFVMIEDRVIAQKTCSRQIRTFQSLTRQEFSL